MSRNNQTSSSMIGNFYYSNRPKSPSKVYNSPLTASNLYSNYSNPTLNTSNVPKGLQNLTNTCYISSIIQIFFRIINQKDFPVATNKNKQEVTQHFFILKRSKSKKDYQSFKQVLQKRIEIVRGWQQQDAHQFLIHLLESFRIENPLPLKTGKTVDLNYKKSENFQDNWERFNNQMIKLQNSKIINMFSGDILKQLCCKRDHKKYNFERFNNISLHFPWSNYSYMQDSIELTKMIEIYLGTEQIDDLYCQECKCKTQFQKKCMIYSPPKYLILHIARFTKSYYQTEKNKTEVKFDSNLSLNLPRETKGNYKLMGIVHHIGSLNRGHYYANVLIQDEWFEMNDQNVYKEKIKPKDNISSTVYMLIYEKY